MRFTRVLFTMFTLSSLFPTADAGTLLFEKRKSSFERKLHPISLDLSIKMQGDTTAKTLDADSKNEEGKEEKLSVKGKYKPLKMGGKYSDQHFEYNKKTSMKIIKTGIGAFFFIAGCIFATGLCRKK